MDRAINRFIRSLTRAGIGVSPAEAIDAMAALASVGLADRETVRTVLRTTLIKRNRDTALFEMMFRLFFGGGDGDVQAATPAEPAAALPDGKRVALDSDDDGIALEGGGDANDRDTLHLQPGSLDALAKRMILARAAAMLDPLMAQASHLINVRAARTGARPGRLDLSEAQPALDVALFLDAVAALLAEDDGGEDDGRPADDGPAPAPAGLPEDLRPALEALLAAETGRRETAAAVPAEPSHPPFGAAERREMEEIVRRLGRRLRGARSYRRVVSHHGRIHVGRTLRRSMAFDGIPFAPVVMAPHRERPRLSLICDVSLSVRTTARFTLHLVYSLQSLFDQVRSYAFVSDLVDISPWFERLAIDDAIQHVFQGGIIDCDANSNYGRALGLFVRDHLGGVDRETTVIILGDGRGNRHPPNVAALEAIRRRAKRLIWLAPEPRGSWGLGASDMGLYAPVCHHALVVRNLAQLGQAVDGLIATDGGRRLDA
jgi:uncharacterized protein with von Willebrand factor type A (vWA) domain